MKRQVGEFEALNLLRSVAESESKVSEEAVARLWSRVSCDVGALALGQGVAATALPQLNSAKFGKGLRTFASRFAIWSAPALVVGAVVGAASQRALSAKVVPVQRVEAVDHAATTVPNMATQSAHKVRTERPDTDVVSVEALALEPESDESRDAPGVKAANTNATFDNRSDGALRRERAVLDPARAALAAGEPARALERANRHLRQFPGGVLSEEREAIAINALVRLSKFDQATRRAAAFRAHYPRSLLTHSVDAAVAAVPK